jgi:hypothetical protein
MTESRSKRIARILKENPLFNPLNYHKEEDFVPLLFARVYQATNLSRDIVNIICMNYLLDADYLFLHNNTLFPVNMKSKELKGCIVVKQAILKIDIIIRSLEKDLLGPDSYFFHKMLYQSKIKHDKAELPCFEDCDCNLSCVNKGYSSVYTVTSFILGKKVTKHIEYLSNCLDETNKMISLNLELNREIDEYNAREKKNLPKGKILPEKDNLSLSYTSNIAECLGRKIIEEVQESLYRIIKHLIQNDYKHNNSCEINIVNDNHKESSIRTPGEKLKTRYYLSKEINIIVKFNNIGL